MSEAPQGGREKLLKWAEWREALTYTAVFYCFLYVFLMLPLAAVLLWKDWSADIWPFGVMLGQVLLPAYPVFVIGYRVRKWLGPLRVRK